MFEATDAEWELPPLPPVPEDLLSIPPEVQAEWDEEGAAWWEESLLRLTPAERFRLEHGADPSSQLLAIEASQDAAAHAQDIAVQAARVRNHADARRIATLLTASDRSSEDLRLRFGDSFADPDGIGAKTFSRSMGLLTMSSPNLVSHEVAVARTLRDRYPTCWAAFRDGDVSWSRARLIVAQADGLEEAHRAAYDAAAARLARTSHRLKDDLRKHRERLQDAAARRARTTHEQRRTSLEPGHDGGAAFVVEGLATTWLPINDALHKAAVAAHGTDPLHRTVAQLRHDIAADLLTRGLEARPAPGDEVLVPDRKPVQVQLTLTVPALAWLGRTTEQAQLAGYGPIAMELAKDLAGSAKSFIRVLTHPYTGARLGMDRQVYRPPADLARWVRIRDGRSRFPGSTTPAHLSDIDHAREWQHGGPTRDTNLVTLARPIHLAKSAGLIEEEYLDTGAVGWADAWGNRFEDPPPDPLDPAPPELLPHRDDGDDPPPF